MDIVKVKDWGFGINTTPLLVSGPCSAETEAQVMESCIGAAAQGANILRAGIWKPRTRPNSFEGVGEVGLAWLRQAGDTTGLPITTEVANARHVELALKGGVDILWIGARTTVNPFAVQEIADAVKGIDIPVMIKNPVNPDLPLWMGAFERFAQSGIRKMAAIHRGFSVSYAAPYRNLPKWDIPIELRRRIPELEIICDPSHICGRRDLLQAVAQQALDLQFDGLMLESHPRPDEAWSDAAQQITAKTLGELMAGLIHRIPQSNDPIFNANMDALRYDIDNLDQEIIALLGQRMMVAREIGRYKLDENVMILQMERWRRIFADRIDAAVNSGLDRVFAESLMHLFHKEAIRQQSTIMQEIKKEKSS